MVRAALIIILSAVVCFGRGRHHGDEHHHHSEPDNSASNLALVSSANKDFATRLYAKLAAQADLQGKNLFFSPICVTLALAALSEGARGDTRQQLLTGMGFNSSLLTQADVNQALQTLLGFNGTAEEHLSAGTALFADEIFQLRPEYLKVVKESYLADGFTVNFTKTKESTDVINAYIREKTNGKIETLVEDLDPATLMYLISFIYFKGMWEMPFDPRLTSDTSFNVDEKKQVRVKMMNLQDTFNSYYDQTISSSVIQLRYSGSSSMLLVLPEKGIAAVDEVICQTHINKWLKWMKPRDTNVFIPKFSIKMSYSLRDVLIGMGVQDVFGATADLSGISEGQRLVVSQVVHQATLDVDEVGTVAAAATGVKLIPYSFRTVPVLRFDHPFIVLITDSNTGNILFMGKVVDPS